MKYRGWMFIGFSDQFPKGKIKARTYMHEECLVYRSQTGQLSMVEPYCSHFGVNMTTGKVVKEFIQCPMHGRTFHGDGTCANSRYRSIRAYPVHEDRGLAFAWFDRAGVEPQWAPPAFLNDEEFPDILWRHARDLELHHPSVPQDNAVDPRHFEYTHSMFGRQTEEGLLELDGHEAIGRMATELLPPLKWVAGGDTSTVTTHYSGPLNDYLVTVTGKEEAHICNFLTIIEGRRCKLTQIGIGRRSNNPLKRFQDLVGMFGSWYATYEDAPVWNNRKVQAPDFYDHQTDKAIAEFREWFDSFIYEDTDEASTEVTAGAEAEREPARSPEPDTAGVA